MLVTVSDEHVKDEYTYLRDTNTGLTVSIARVLAHDDSSQEGNRDQGKVETHGVFGGRLELLRGGC